MKPWYEDATNHIWWTFFRKTGTYKEQLNRTELKQWDACQEVFDGLTDAERVLLKIFYTSKREYANRAVQVHAVASGLQSHDVWSTIRKARRLVGVKIGLLEPREGADDEIPENGC